MFNFTTVIVFVSFVVFMYLLKAMFFDPMIRIRAQREEKMLNDRQSAQAILAQLQSLQSDYDDQLKAARRKAQEIVVSQTHDAKKVASDSLAQARENARGQIDAKLAELSQWREETYQQLGNERQQLKEIILHKISAGSPSPVN